MPIVEVGESEYEFRRPFICSKELCRDKLKKSDPERTMENASERNKVVFIFNDLFADAWPLGKDDISWPDELDPELVTEYIISEKDLKSPWEDVYSFVCTRMVSHINRFYKELREFATNGRMRFLHRNMKRGISPLHTNEEWLLMYINKLKAKAAEKNQNIRRDKN